MANWYILAYYDELNNMRLFPEVVRVRPGDNVIWASNLDEQYIAGDFSSPGLFPDSSYDMPSNDQSLLRRCKCRPPTHAPLPISTHAHKLREPRWGMAIPEAGSSSLTHRARDITAGRAKRGILARKKVADS